MIRKGTAYVDEFRYAKDPIKLNLFKERIEEYLRKDTLVGKLVAMVISEKL